MEDVPRRGVRRVRRVEDVGRAVVDVGESGRLGLCCGAHGGTKPIACSTSWRIPYVEIPRLVRPGAPSRDTAPGRVLAIPAGTSRPILGTKCPRSPRRRRTRRAAAVVEDGVQLVGVLQASAGDALWAIVSQRPHGLAPRRLSVGMRRAEEVDVGSAVIRVDAPAPGFWSDRASSSGRGRSTDRSSPFVSSWLSVPSAGTTYMKWTWGPWNVVRHVGPRAISERRA